MLIRRATQEDAAAIWSIIGPVIRCGETYALPRDMPKEEALAHWLAADRETFVAVVDGSLVGTYYMLPNRSGGGDHVANCGYVTAQAAGGRGIARSMCLHSLEHARAHGFLAMQFNFVVSTNEHAVRLWQSLGFEVVGRLPGAFHHPSKGFVDALVMFKTLAPMDASDSTRVPPDRKPAISRSD